MKRLFLILFLLVLSLPVFQADAASNYYVDGVSGNDSWEGSESRPWKSITKAAYALGAGDTVYVKSGTYREVVRPSTSGNSSNYITYRAYPGHTVTLDGSTLAFGWGNGLFTISGRSYIQVEGFRIINSDMFGVCISNSSNIKVSDCYFYNCDGSGVWAGDSSRNITVDSNEVYACCADSFQEGISLVGVNGFEIANNWVHDFPVVYYDSGDGKYHPKEGIDAKVGSTNGSIHHNKVHGTRTGIYLDGYSAVTANTSVYNNLVYDIEEVGIAINAEQGGRVENCRIYNNICHSVDYHGLKINNQASSYTNIYFVNNTTYNNGGNALQIVEGGSTIFNLVVRNNTFSCASGKGVLFVSGFNSSQHHFDHNLYQYGPYIGSDFLIGDPGFVSASDFHLKSSSQVINKGSDIDAPTFDYEDKGRVGIYDLGAYEYNGTDYISPTTSPSPTSPDPAVTPTPISTPKVTPKVTPTVTPTPSPIVKAGAHDINSDSFIDVLDMKMVDSHWGESGYPGWIEEDICKDGHIDILDLMEIGMALS